MPPATGWATIDEKACVDLRTLAVLTALPTWGIWMLWSGNREAHLVAEMDSRPALRRALKWAGIRGAALGLIVLLSIGSGGFPSGLYPIAAVVAGLVALGVSAWLCWFMLYWRGWLRSKNAMPRGSEPE